MSTKDFDQRESWKLHYEATVDQFAQEEILLGPWSSYSLVNDPKHMSFVLSRYKFVSKIISAKKNILEIGCGDGFGFPIVAQNAEYILGIDWEERNIEGNKRRIGGKIKNGDFLHIDITKEKPKKIFDAAFSIDVIEHLVPEDEKIFMENTLDVLSEDSICIIGTPNESSSSHASHRSDHQHINLKDHKTMYSTLDQYFKNTLVFSMNDEIVHTGYYPMAHYLFGVGIGKK